MLLSLISTSPLHSEIIESPISQNLANMFKDAIFLESDEEDYPDWDNASLSSQDSFEEEQEINKPPDPPQKPRNTQAEMLEFPLDSIQDAPSPASETTENSTIEEPERSYDKPTELLHEFFISLCEKSRGTSPPGFVLPWPYRLVAERELLNKILMMLLGMDTDIFTWSHDSFSVTQLVQVSHLTPVCLTNTLDFFARLGTLLNLIRNTCEELKDDECLTHQYFGHACKEIVNEFNREIGGIQEELAIQAGNTARKSLKKLPQNIISLISLQNRLCPMYDYALIIQSSIKNLSKDPITKTRDILNYLYKLIQNNYSLTDFSAFSIVVRIFLVTVKPFLEELCIWLSQGTVSNLDPGFCIEKSEEKGSMRDTWENTFKISLHKGTSVLPGFLQQIEKEILIIGKNMMLIRKIEDTILDHVLIPPSPLLVGLETYIYEGLLQSTGHFLNQIKPAAENSIESVVWNFNSLKTLHLAPVTEFSEFQIEASVPPASLLLPSHYLIPAYKVVTSQECSRLHPIQTWISFQSVIELTIEKVVAQIYTDTCEHLLMVLRNKLNLSGCFTSLREVLLMENGECMQALLKYINKTSDQKKFFDNSYELRNAFSEGMSAIKNKELIPHFSCEIIGDSRSQKIKSLDNICINFSPPTHLDICFDESILHIYQKLFTRILQIKRALHCAKNLRWRSREMVGSGATQKKFLILQKKLIHFTICYEEYIMQNVLHSCVNVFKVEEAKAKSIDELRSAHQRYLGLVLDRCLLSEKAKPLNNAVTAVFRCCGKFFKLMKMYREREMEENLEIHDLFEGIQQSYDTANRFLMQVLSKSLQNRRNLQCK